MQTETLRAARKAVVLLMSALLVTMLVVAANVVCSQPEQAQAATTTKVKIGTKTFKMKFASGKPAKAFKKYLKNARTLKMNELNGNEKYHYFSKKTFPQKVRHYSTIHAGDVMLYGNDCLVIFYKTFTTPYSYTKIGKLTSTKGLVKAAGTGSVKVRFNKVR